MEDGETAEAKEDNPSESERLEGEDEDDGEGDVTMRAGDLDVEVEGGEGEGKGENMGENAPMDETVEGGEQDNQAEDETQQEEIAQEEEVEEAPRKLFGTIMVAKLNNEASPALSIQPFRPHSSHPPPPTSAAVKALFGLEIKFAALRDRLYIERMEETAAEEEMILNGISYYLEDGEKGS
jgi:hypothetical protein